MVKKRIDVPEEVSKIWKQAKKNLTDLGQKTIKLAQKGEKEVVRASRIGKLQLDIVTINLKKENIFRQVGKKAYDMYSKKAEIKSTKLVSLFNQASKLNQQIKAKKAKIVKLNKE